MQENSLQVATSPRSQVISFRPQLGMRDSAIRPKPQGRQDTVFVSLKSLYSKRDIPSQKRAIILGQPLSDPRNMGPRRFERRSQDPQSCRIPGYPMAPHERSLRMQNRHIRISHCADRSFASLFAVGHRTVLCFGSQVTKNAADNGDRLDHFGYFGL